MLRFYACWLQGIARHALGCHRLVSIRRVVAVAVAVAVDNEQAIKVDDLVGGLRVSQMDGFGQKTCTDFLNERKAEGGVCDARAESRSRPIAACDPATCTASEALR